MNFSVFCRNDSYSNQLGTELSEILCRTLGWNREDEYPNLVLCIGGDGTLLRAIHYYENQLGTILFTAIHTGTLGFFTDYTKDQLDLFIEEISRGIYRIEEYPLIEAVLNTGKTYHALNEIRIGNFAYTVYYDIFIDGEFFESTSSCGLCVSTQAGSTGANRALGGAVIEDGLNVIEMTQIMPVSHNNQHSLVNPYILNQHREITLRGHSLQESVLCYDHNMTDQMQDVTEVKIHLSDQKVRFARFHPYSYLKRLRNLF